MIILDDDVNQVPKLASPAPIHAQPAVNRCSTPTYSLPDYETSEAQQHSAEPWKPKRRTHRFRRWVLIGLVVYTVLTLVIGAPLIYLKLRHSRSASAPSSIWNPQQANVVVPGQEVVRSPPLFEHATNCDQWTKLDHTYAGMLISTYNYTMPCSLDIFVGSNATFKADDPSTAAFGGSLLVDINDDPSVSQITFGVSMTYSSKEIRNRTHVCLADVYGSNGFYIYVPTSLNKSDTLFLDVTMLFPQNKSFNVSSFATMLPQFQQRFGVLSPQINFSDVFLGGPMSSVAVGLISADNLAVMSSPGPIKGSFQASYQLILETISAAIDANITMYTDPDNGGQSSIRLNTGNNRLNASINLVQLTPSSSRTPPSSFYINANTFNGPLSLNVTQDPGSSRDPLPVFVYAGNNLGESNVSMDKNFQGNFLAQTEYATVIVQDLGKDSDSPFAMDDVAGSNDDDDDDSAVDTAGRTIYYDNPTDSDVHGWVGKGTRPDSSGTGSGAPGCVEVYSVLSPVTLQLG